MTDRLHATAGPDELAASKTFATLVLSSLHPAVAFTGNPCVGRTFQSFRLHNAGTMGPSAEGPPVGWPAQQHSSNFRRKGSNVRPKRGEPGYKRSVLKRGLTIYLTCEAMVAKYYGKHLQRSIVHHQQSQEQVSNASPERGEPSYNRSAAKHAWKSIFSAKQRREAKLRTLWDNRAQRASPPRMAESGQVDAGIHFDGIYMAPNRHFLRFYEEDNVVIAVTSTVKEGEENSIMEWFHKDNWLVSKGTYRLSGADISFTTASRTGHVEYRGKFVSSTEFQLHSHSMINGHESDLTYDFVGAKGDKPTDGQMSVSEFFR